MHRIGGLEKEDGTGNVNYDPENHEHMMRIRAEKVARHRLRHPAGRGRRPRRRRAARARLGVHVGPIQAAVRRVRAGGKQVAHAHLVHLNPFPANLGEVLSRYQRSSCPR